MRQKIWMLPAATQAVIQQMSDGEHKQLRGKFKGLLRERTATKNHEAIALEVENIVNARVTA